MLVVLSETLEHLANVIFVVLFIVTEDENVVQIYNNTDVSHVAKMLFMKCWKVAGELVIPKSMTKYSKDPYLVRKAVFHSCPGAILTLL